jgi:hypothetical protein
MKIFKVIKEYISSYPESILFKKYETVIPGKEYNYNPNWKNWIWCEGQNNNRAWVPKQFLSLKNKHWVLNQNYDALELSVNVGEKLVVHDEINGFVKAEKTNGEIGWVPSENLELLKYI